MIVQDPVCCVNSPQAVAGTENTLAESGVAIPSLVLVGLPNGFKA